MYSHFTVSLEMFSLGLHILETGIKIMLQKEASFPFPFLIWVGHVALVELMGFSYKIEHFKDLGIGGRTVLGWILHKYVISM
jgi:hypothetical protein